MNPSAHAQEDRPNQFEVGHFYLVRPSMFLPHRFPALCVKKCKNRVLFEYLAWFVNGHMQKTSRWLTLLRSPSGEECVFCTKNFRIVMLSYPYDVVEKPKDWDSIPSAFGGCVKTPEEKAAAEKREKKNYFKVLWIEEFNEFGKEAAKANA